MPVRVCFRFSSLLSKPTRRQALLFTHDNCYYHPMQAPQYSTMLKNTATAPSGAVGSVQEVGFPIAMSASSNNMVFSKTHDKTPTFQETRKENVLLKGTEEKIIKHEEYEKLTSLRANMASARDRLFKLTNCWWVSRLKFHGTSAQVVLSKLEKLHTILLRDKHRLKHLPSLKWGDCVETDKEIRELSFVLCQECCDLYCNMSVIIGETPQAYALDLDSMVATSSPYHKRLMSSLRRKYRQTTKRTVVGKKLVDEEEEWAREQDPWSLFAELWAMKEEEELAFIVSDDLLLEDATDFVVHHQVNSLIDLEMDELGMLATDLAMSFP